VWLEVVDFQAQVLAKVAEAATMEVAVVGEL